MSKSAIKHHNLPDPPSPFPSTTIMHHIFYYTSPSLHGDGAKLEQTLTTLSDYIAQFSISLPLMLSFLNSYLLPLKINEQPQLYFSHCVIGWEIGFYILRMKDGMTGLAGDHEINYRDILKTSETYFGNIMIFFSLDFGAKWKPWGLLIQKIIL